MPRPAHFAAEAYDTGRFAKAAGAVEWWGVSHHRKLLIQIAAVLVALPVLYILSSGPVLSFADSHFPAGAKLEAIYRPLVRLSIQMGCFDPLHTYLGFWDVHVSDIGDEFMHAP